MNSRHNPRLVFIGEEESNKMDTKIWYFGCVLILAITLMDVSGLPHRRPSCPSTKVEDSVMSQSDPVPNTDFQNSKAFQDWAKAYEEWRQKYPCPCHKNMSAIEYYNSYYHTPKETCLNPAHNPWAYLYNYFTSPFSQPIKIVIQSPEQSKKQDHDEIYDDVENNDMVVVREPTHIHNKEEGTHTHVEHDVKITEHSEEPHIHPNDNNGQTVENPGNVDPEPQPRPYVLPKINTREGEERYKSQREDSHSHGQVGEHTSEHPEPEAYPHQSRREDEERHESHEEKSYSHGTIPNDYENNGHETHHQTEITNQHHHSDANIHTEQSHNHEVVGSTHSEERLVIQDENDENDENAAIEKSIKYNLDNEEDIKALVLTLKEMGINFLEMGHRILDGKDFVPFTPPPPPK